jgi:hypothetical protein
VTLALWCASGSVCHCVILVETQLWKRDATERSEADRWILWVEVDQDEHIFREVVIDKSGSCSVGGVSVDQSDERGTAYLSMPSWPLTAVKGRPVGIWSRHMAGVEVRREAAVIWHFADER